MLSELKTGDSVNQAVIVRKISVRTIRNGSILTSFIFEDKSGAVPGVLWDAPDCKDGDVVTLAGTVGYYDGGVQVQVEGVEIIPPDKVSSLLPLLIASSKMTKETLVRRMTELIGKIKSQEIRSFVSSLLSDNDSFYQSPAGKRLHHAWIGGLAEHTISVGRIVTGAMSLYPWIDADIAMAGALLHDIGKTRELALSPSIEYGDTGRLLGHIYIGAQMVNVHRSKSPVSTESLEDIIHIILSHHGENEFGAPVKPATLEAQLVYLADKMDSGMLLAKGLTDSDNTPGNWTTFDRVVGRSFRKSGAVKLANKERGIEGGPEPAVINSEKAKDDSDDVPF
ncbi:MAG: HD domain-containing protein [Deltaproteobacteria bacterium]|nr:HD domain-containing protein [Deltaproteobacteria bacterium]